MKLSSSSMYAGAPARTVSGSVWFCTAASRSSARPEAADDMSAAQPARPATVHSARATLAGPSAPDRAVGLETFSGPARLASDLFLDARRRARAIAQVVQLGPPHVTAAPHLDGGHRGAVGLEDALDALAVGDLAHGERGIQPAVALRDHDSLERLQPLPLAFGDLHLHDHRVARMKLRHGLL